MSEMIERAAKALSIAAGNHPEACSNDEDEQPMWTLYLEDARAVFRAIRELPEEPGPRYSAGEYSRSNHEAMIDDALLHCP